MTEKNVQEPKTNELTAEELEQASGGESNGKRIYCKYCGKVTPWKGQGMMSCSVCGKTDQNFVIMIM